MLYLPQAGLPSRVSYSLLRMLALLGIRVVCRLVQPGEQPCLDELLWIWAAADQHAPTTAAADQHARTAAPDEHARTANSYANTAHSYADRRAAGGQPHPAVRIACAVWA